MRGYGLWSYILLGLVIGLSGCLEDPGEDATGGGEEVSATDIEATGTLPAGYFCVVVPDGPTYCTMDRPQPVPVEIAPGTTQLELEATWDAVSAQELILYYVVCDPADCEETDTGRAAGGSSPLRLSVTDLDIQEGYTLFVGMDTVTPTEGVEWTIQGQASGPGSPS